MEQEKTLIVNHFKKTTSAIVSGVLEGWLRKEELNPTVTDEAWEAVADFAKQVRK